MSALPTAPLRRPPGVAEPSVRTAGRDRRRTATQPPQLRAVPAAASRRSGWAVMCWLMVSAIVVVGVIGVVALNALAAESSFAAMEVENRITELTLRHDNLVAEVAMLETPARVRQVATAQLGLVEPEQPGFLVIQQDQGGPRRSKTTVRLEK